MTEPESSEPGPAKPPADDQIANLGPLGMVTQLGFVFAGPVVGGALGAYYIERRFGGGALVIIAGVLLGVVAGIAGAYRVVKPYLE